METKIIKVVFGGRRYAVTNKRTRTDYGQMFEFVDLALPDTFEVIFSNSNTSAGTGKKMIGSNQRCLIPDEYLKTGQPIYAWILLHDGEDDGRHMYSIKSPVDDMPDTSPEEPTPVEQSVISQAITALNSAVTTTTQKAQEASASADRAEHAAEGVEGYAERAETAQSAAESARDRATQAETSARTSAATATEKASEAISSATTASQSAITAESASESAQASADASYQNAETAYRYAQDSATSAGQADESAQTASSKASEASQSASIASARAIEADTAAGASIDAKNDAVTAQTAAQTAKTSAESARDEAQNIADGITGKVEQIDSNTERIESLEDDRYKPYPTDTASGSIASFSDGADNIPLKSCIVQIEPVQEGSGDPSPDNVRPISGWTGCEVQRTGVNLWDEEWEIGTIRQSDGLFAPDNTRIRSKNFNPCVPETTYYVKDPTNGNNIALRWYDANKGFISSSSWIGNTTITSPANAYYFAFVMASSYGTTYNHDISINYPATDTDYHPYAGDTYPITFPTEAGTVYGGYVDMLSGVLRVENIHRVINENDDFGHYGDTGFTFKSTGMKSGLAQNGLCNLAPTVSRLTTKYGVLFGANNSIIYFAQAKRVWEVTTIDDAIRWAIDHGLELVYPLAEPIDIQLDAHTIKTLLGENNIWADTGNTEVEYRADVTKYIDRKITEAVSALT